MNPATNRLSGSRYNSNGAPTCSITTSAQHDNLVGKCHRLDLIVGDVDHRRANLLVQTRNFDPHFNTQFGIEVRKGFVEQEHLGPAHNGTADADPLALATRQSGGLTIQIRFKLQDPGRLGHFGIYLGFRMLVHPQPETHVFLDGHVRVKRVGLEHHRNASIRRICAGHIAGADIDLATRGFLQPGDHPQQCGFTASRWADENAEFTVFNFQIDPVNDLNVAVFLDNIGQCDARHELTPLLRFWCGTVHPGTANSGLHLQSTRPWPAVPGPDAPNHPEIFDWSQS